MHATAVLAQLDAVGVRISRRRFKLLAQPKAQVTEPVLVLLRAHKEELLARLPDQAANAPPAHSSIAGNRSGKRISVLPGAEVELPVLSM
jgi:hypothetical protein